MTRNLFPFQITKRVYLFSILSIIIPLLLITLATQVQYYNSEIKKREQTLYSVARILDRGLEGSFRDILDREKALNKPVDEQVYILNGVLQPEINHMISSFPGVGMGYYSLELNRKIAFGPNFTPDRLISIPADSLYMNVYKEGKPFFLKISSSYIWNGKSAYVLVYPIYRNGLIIGHIYVNTRLTDLYAAIFKDVIVISIIGWAVALLTIALSWKFFKKLKTEIEQFSDAVASGDLKRFGGILPELNPIITLIRKHTQELELGVSRLKREIAKRREVEGELVAANDKITSILDNVRNSVIATEFDGKIIYWNRFAETLYGWKFEEILGKHISSIEVVPCNLGIHERIVRETVFKKGYWEGDIEIIRKDGLTVPVHRIVTSIKGPDGTPMGIISVGIDLTERKKMEKEIARLDQMHMIGEMAAGIGHEVRNPMTTVRGFMQLLAVKEENPAKREKYDLMIKELDRANSIITEYLSLAKNKKVELKPGNLNAVLKNLFPLLQADAMVSDKYIRTELQDMPDLLLDENEISQLVLNLVRNGLEAINHGGTVTLKTYLNEEEVVLAVSDQGTGIDPEILDRIGTPFVTTKDQGTGLGLAVSYSIAGRHNAKIDVETGPKGTTFFVRFIGGLPL